MTTTAIHTSATHPAAFFTESDLVNVTARVVAVPLRELYGLLWRAGVLEIVA